VKLGPCPDQPRSPALTLGPSPKGHQLTRGLNHQSAGEDRVAREVLRIHPVARTEVNLGVDHCVGKFGNSGDLAHLPNWQKRGINVH